jgi:MraZ protein
VFKGTYRHSVDDKGRVTVPARFRDALGDDFILTRGLDGCIFLYPRAAWQELEAKLASLLLGSAGARDFKREFFRNASDAEVDRQGRVLIPPELRQITQIERDVVIIGVSERVEVWPETRWEEYMQERSGNFERLAEQLGVI